MEWLDDNCCVTCKYSEVTYTPDGTDIRSVMCQIKEQFVPIDEICEKYEE